MNSREGEIQTIFDFLSFSVKPDTSFQGSICFHFQDLTTKEEIQDKTKLTSYIVHIDEKKTVTYHQAGDSNVDADCHVTISLDDFLYIYSGKASATNIARMCYSGRVNVHGYAFRKLSHFAASFDFSSEMWKKYYVAKKSYKALDSLSDEELNLEYPLDLIVQSSLANASISCKRVDDIRKKLNRMHYTTPYSSLKSEKGKLSSLGFNPDYREKTKWQRAREYIDSIDFFPVAVAEKKMNGIEEIELDLRDLVGITGPLKEAPFLPSINTTEDFARTSWSSCVQKPVLMTYTKTSPALKRSSLKQENKVESLTSKLKSQFQVNTPSNNGYVPAYEILLKEIKNQTGNIIRYVHKKAKLNVSSVSSNSEKIPWIWNTDKNDETIQSEKNAIHLIKPRIITTKSNRGNIMKQNLKRDVEIGKKVLKESFATFIKPPEPCKSQEDEIYNRIKNQYWEHI